MAPCTLVRSGPRWFTLRAAEAMGSSQALLGRARYFGFFVHKEVPSLCWPVSDRTHSHTCALEPPSYDAAAFSGCQVPTRRLSPAPAGRTRSRTPAQRLARTMPLLVQSALKNSCDGEPLAALAKKVPAVRRTGDRTADRVKSIQRGALIRIVDQLSKYPEYILPLHGVMMSEDLLVSTKQQTQHRLEWSGDYKVLASIPIAWEAQYLISRFRSLGIQMAQETLDLVEAQNPDDIKLLFAFDIQCALTLPMPAECKDAKIATQTFVRRAEVCGDRLKHLAKTGAFKQPGRVLFSEGCFSLEFDATTQVVTRVKHICGESVAIPPHVRITQDFDLVDNHLDQFSRVELPLVSFNLASFFSASVSFKSHMQVPGKRFKLLARVAESAAIVDSEKKAAEESTIVHVNVQRAEQLVKEKAKATMQRAREQATAMQEARKKRRIISLGGAVALPALAAE